MCFRRIVRDYSVLRTEARNAVGERSCTLLSFRDSNDQLYNVVGEPAHLTSFPASTHDSQLFQSCTQFLNAANEVYDGITSCQEMLRYIHHVQKNRFVFS